MKFGNLFYDTEINRVNVSWADGSYGDGYHCGDVIKVRRPEDTEFRYLRLEYDHGEKEWYFSGVGEIPFGTEVRVD